MDKNRCNSKNDIICDYGGQPLIVNINRFSRLNPYYRTALWTGEYFQVTLMSIRVGGDIGLEVHNNLDQLIRIESGHGIVRMGKDKNHPDYIRRVDSNFAVFIPAGTWHNLINTGNMPIKLYSVYAPPQHPFSTVHKTKEDAERAEGY